MMINITVIENKTKEHYFECTFPMEDSEYHIENILQHICNEFYHVADLTISGGTVKDHETIRDRLNMLLHERLSIKQLCL